MISPDELVHRARARCKHHRQPGVGGVCRECLLAEIEQAIADEHPELDRGDVFDLVQKSTPLGSLPLAFPSTSGSWQLGGDVFFAP